MRWIFSLVLASMLLLTGCNIESALNPPTETPTPLPTPNDGTSMEIGRVTRVIDGDTIDVMIDGTEERVRYIGVNTPERDEPCYSDATDANRALVEGQTVRLVIDTSNRDRFDRLLRYVYVGETFVNEALVRDGWAEVARYEPDTAFFDSFRSLEQSATASDLGCHPTGIFDDGTFTR